MVPKMPLWGWRGRDGLRRTKIPGREFFSELVYPDRCQQRLGLLERNPTVHPLQTPSPQATQSATEKKKCGHGIIFATWESLSLRESTIKRLPHSTPPPLPVATRPRPARLLSSS